MARSHCDGEAAEVVFWHLVPLEVFQPRSTAWRFQSGPQAHRRGLYISHFSLSPITFRIPQEELESLAREMDSCLAFTLQLFSFSCDVKRWILKLTLTVQHLIFCFVFWSFLYFKVLKLNYLTVFDICVWRCICVIYLDIVCACRVTG